jgi:hypothetical protein
MRPDARDRMIDDIVEKLARYITDGDLASPNSAHVAVA